MALKTLADIYIRDIFERAALEPSVRLSAIVGSGGAAEDPRVAGLVAANNGRVIVDHFYRDLTRGDPDIGDDTANKPTPDQIPEGDYNMRKGFYTKSWGEADIVNNFGFLPDPLGQTAQLVQGWWSDWYDEHAIASLNGILEDNLDTDSGDMVHNIWTNAAADAANSISRAAVIDAAGTSGDHADDYAVIIMHSTVFNTLDKANEIETVYPSDTLPFRSFRGLRVVQSDSCFVSDGTVLTGVGSATNAAYVTYLMGPGAIRIGRSDAGITGGVSEIDRQPSEGMGAGRSTLVTRQQYVLHPMGFSFLSASVAGESPTKAELQNAANWNRIAGDRKHVRIAALISRA